MRLLVVACLFALSACTTTTLVKDPEMRRRAAAVQILSSEESTSDKVTIIKEVVGRDCCISCHRDPSEETARTELRIAASKEGADAVANVICQQKGFSLSPACDRSIECRGDAVKLKPPR